MAGLTCAIGLSQDETPKLIPDWWARQIVVPVPRARPQAPTIDGNVGYREWYYASTVDGFIDADTGVLSDLPVRMYACWDEQFVYVAAYVQRPPMYPTPRATFTAGRHEHIWWQDDNFELVIQPGRREQGVGHYYAFVGNSVGAWSLMRGELEGSGGDSTWPADWKYAATRQGREAWAAELAIPVGQLTEAEQPGPGAVWFMDLMSQQVTPAKRMVDLGMVWNLGMHGYRSPVIPKFVFVDGGPITRPHGMGRLSQTQPQRDAGEETTGARMVLYNEGAEPITLEGRMQLFKAPPDRPEGALDLYRAWDITRQIRETGKPWLDPTQEIQAFRSEEDILRELNARFKFVDGRAGPVTVPAAGPEAGGAAYFALEKPIENGEYILAYRFADAATGEVLASQVVPYAMLPGLQVSLRPYFLTHHKIRAEASLSNLALAEGDRVGFTLQAAGATLDEVAAPVVPGAEAAHAYLDCTALEPDVEATVTARLIKADGTEGISNSATITRPPNPEWFGNNIGRSQVVPPPFEPVRTEGERVVRLWQRRIELGDGGLPASVTSRDTEILARPIALDTGGKPQQWSLARLVCDDRDARFRATGTLSGLAATMDVTMHYDGTGRFDLVLDPGDQPRELQRLVLEVPLKTEWAQLATHNATWTDPQRQQIKGFAGSVDEWLAKYPGGAIPFTFATFLGTEDRGVQWLCESDRGWSNADEERVVSISREGDATVLRIAMVDSPLQITEPWTLTFGLTVTPIKDTTQCRTVFRASEGKVYEREDIAGDEDIRKFDEAYSAAGINAIGIYMTDDNHFGCPRIYNPDQEKLVSAYADLVHERGFTIGPYSGWGVNANIPEFSTFGQEMLAEPVKNIGWGCFLHVHNQVLADWWLDGAKYTVEHSRLDGMYMDGFAMPRLLQNELEGYAWTDAQGRERGTYPIWSVRDFIERLYIYCHAESPRPARVRNHYNEETYCIGGFTDERVTGEGQYHAGDTILAINSPSAFRANFMTHLNGVATTGLWWNYLKLPVTRNEMRAMFLLHDVPMVVGGGIVRYYGNQIGYGRKARPWVHLHKVRSAFDGAQFIGYWQQALVRCDPEGPLASAWVDRERGRALVVVANLPDQPWHGTVTFDREALGIGPATEARDAMFDGRPSGDETAIVDEPLPMNGDAMALDIKPQRYRLIIFGDRVPIPENPRITNEDEE